MWVPLGVVTRGSAVVMPGGSSVVRRTERPLFANGRHPDYSSPGSNNLVSALANKGRSVLRTTDVPPGITTALPRVTTPSGTQIPLTGGYPNCGTQSNGYQCPTSDFGNVYRTSATKPLDEPASGAWKLCVADTGASGARQVVKHVALTVH